jgi:hypothetical protein
LPVADPQPAHSRIFVKEVLRRCLQDLGFREQRIASLTMNTVELLLRRAVAAAGSRAFTWVTVGLAADASAPACKHQHHIVRKVFATVLHIVTMVVTMILP